MAGILVQLALSWLLVWLFEKKDLRILGFFPSRRRIFDFALFFMVTALLCAAGFLVRIHLGNERWEINPVISLRLIAEGLWWNIKSVLFEELIFRGALFYILIKRLGAKKAILISSIAFGIYHWFSFGIIGQPVQMTVIFFLTGFAGLVYAYGYAKTFSLYIPCGIHLGWNFTHGFIFSEGSIGHGVLVRANPAMRFDSYFMYALISIFPMIFAFGLNYLLLKKRKQEPDPTDNPRELSRTKKVL